MTEDERRLWRMVPIQVVWFLRGGLIAVVVIVGKITTFDIPIALRLPVILFLILGGCVGGLLWILLLWAQE